MLIHEISQLSTNDLGIGWDEIWDSTSVANYTFYGLAPLGTSQSDPKWWIIVYKTNPQAVRYYPANQVWSTRTTALALP